MVSVQTVIDWSMTLSTLAFADANLKFEVVELRLSLLLMFMLRNMLATVSEDLVIKLKKSDFKHRFRLRSFEVEKCPHSVRMKHHARCPQVA